jgi:hypothetical protein
MSYQNPSQQVMVLQHLPWYSVPALMAELKAIRSINFSVVENRQQALERLGKMLSDAPFSPAAAPDSRRFAPGQYVCEGLGDWPRKFMQLKSALSHRDSNLMKAAFTEGKQPQIGADVNQSYSDAQQAFWNSTTAMIDQIIKLDHVYDRAKFEATFSAAWA